MANYNGSCARLLLDGTNVTGYITEVNIDPTVGEEDTTSGNVSFTDVEPKLRTDKYTFKVSYDQANLQSYIQKIKPGTKVLVEWGPEGAVSGKPRHVAYVLMSGSPVGQTTDKKFVVFDAKGTSKGAPLYDMFAGATY